MECPDDAPPPAAAIGGGIASHVFNVAGTQPPPSSEQFLSWISVSIVLIMFLFFRSVAGPFLNPTAEARKAVSSSFYFNLMATLYVWLVSATALTILPHFTGGEGNAMVAAGLFFPMAFASVSAIVAGRFCVRMAYYASMTTRMVEEAGVEAWKSSNTSSVVQSPSNSKDNVSETAIYEPGDSPRDAFCETIHAKLPQLKLVAFQRPFRKLVKASIIISAILCLLYAHCWSSKLSAFKVSRSDGAGAVCRAVFSPLVFGGLSKSHITGGFHQHDSADELSILFVWATCILANLFSFAQDEFAGKHCIRDDTTDDDGTSLGRSLSEDADAAMNSWIGDSEKNQEGSGHDKSRGVAFPFIRPNIDGPEDTLPMVPWYSVVLIYSVFDLLVAFKVFLGRFDARTMQPALQSTARQDTADKDGVLAGEGETKEKKLKKLQQTYVGCVFDMSSGGSWFDFAADTGDGFDSSYQVARMLAQPQLHVVQDGEERQLPRGEFLVIGGDLAYPDPTEEAYEKRFFRPFQDAMQPPPSFRRRAISTRKPALPVQGWSNCFNKSRGTTKDDGISNYLLQYKGPCAFAIPGNHDWYDGLVTYTRFIIGRDWLGGWLMPQERSYFALKLQKGWWLFAADLGLSADVDLEQFKFFANVAAHMDESDAVIIVTHEPHWVLDPEYDADELAEENLRELIDTHLKGKVRLRLAGDLHHYTRHSPIFASQPPLPLLSKESKRSISLSDRGNRFDVNTGFAANDPELIVSGGGGAFLHGTHTFRKYVSVGENKQKYKRVCCYPAEKISIGLGWLNIPNFRFRNWRLDIIWAVAAFGIASSLFPLCGIYDDYLERAHDQGPLKLAIWLFTRILSLFGKILSTGRVSLFFTLAVTFALFLLTDTKPSPKVRVFVSLGHAAAHIVVSLFCLVLIQCLVEWLIADEIVAVVSISSSSNADEEIHGEGVSDLASCLYDEYMAHWSHVLANFTGNLTHINNLTRSSTSALGGDAFDNMSAFGRIHAYTYEGGRDVMTWLYDMSPLSSTLYVFDLPGLIATKHHKMCEILCADGVECMLSSDPSKFLLIDRLTMIAYLCGIFLYFAIMAVPMAGGVFGTWLALMLNVVKAQYNEGFSSLRIPHWKNFLKIHIDDKGELEVYSVGLHRVPQRWVKDTAWRGDKGSASDTPSWSQERPSKWIPLRESKKFTPEVVDYIRISKRSVRRSASPKGVATPSGTKRHRILPTIRRTSSY